MGKKKTSPSKSLKKPKGKDKQDDALPGWPGYRTRRGRSGYDPIDSRTEAAHTAGTLIQRLFTGQFTNPYHVLPLGALGLILAAPLFIGILESLNGNLFPWSAWVFLLVSGITGILILMNFVRNLIGWLTR